MLVVGHGFLIIVFSRWSLRQHGFRLVRWNDSSLLRDVILDTNHSTGNQTYMQAALNSTQLLSINVSEGGVLRYYNNYCSMTSILMVSYVLNGYIYTLVSLYDLIQEFNDSVSIELYDNGIQTLNAMIGLFDLGCSSSYDLVHHSVPGSAPNIARVKVIITHTLLSFL